MFKSYRASAIELVNKWEKTDTLHGYKPFNKEEV